MAKIPRKLQKIFGITAGASQIGKFGSLAQGTPLAYTGAAADPEVLQALSQYSGGWFSGVLGNSNPAIEDMNGLFFTITYQLAYLFQAGVPEWNAATEYHVGSIANDGSGVTYRSIQNTNLNHALSDPSWWTVTSGGGGGSGLVNTPVSANVTVATGQALLVNSTAASRTISTPTGVTGNQFLIADDKRTATTNNIIINPPTGTNFQGLGTNIPLTINTAGGAYWFFWDGSVYTYVALGASGGGGSGGLTPVDVNSTGTSTAFTRELCDVSSATITRTLPVTTAAVSVYYTDALEVASASKFIRVSPGAGDQIGAVGPGNSFTLDYPRVSAGFHKSAGSTIWRTEYQIASLGGGSGSGGLAGVLATSNVALASVQKMYECTSTGGFTIQLPPIPAAGGVIGVMDAGQTCSPTNYVRIMPATGESIDGYPVNDNLDLDYPKANVTLYAAAGATSWKVQWQSTTMITGDTIPPATASITTGFKGSEIISTASVAVPTAGTAYNTTSISVPPGLWDIGGQNYVQQAAGTFTCTAISTNSASIAGLTLGKERMNGAVNNGSGGAVVLPFRVLLATTTTFYLCGTSDGTTGSAYGTIRAVRQ